MTRTVLGILSFGLVLILAAAQLPVDDEVAAQTPGPVPVATIGQLERAMVGPSSDAIFNVGRAEPATDDEWLALEDAAVVLTEAANLYMMDGRRADDGEWMTMAGAMYDAGRAALVAVQARDADAILDAGNNLVEACEACHVPYRDGGRPMGPPPGAVAPE